MGDTATAQARGLQFGGKHFNFQQMMSESTDFLLVCAFHAAFFFLLWVYTKIKRQPDISKKIDTSTRSIYFNCSHKKAAPYAGILFVFCIIVGFSLLILKAPICLYMNAPAHMPFQPLLSITALATMPIGYLAGMRSAYLCFQHWSSLKASPLDHRYCAGSILLYSMFMYMSYRIALPLLEGSSKCASLV